MSGYQLVIIGASEAGRSLLREAAAGGLTSIALVDSGSIGPVEGEHRPFPATTVSRIKAGDRLEVEANGQTLDTEVVVVAAGIHEVSVPPAYEVPTSLQDRIHYSFPELTGPADVLVVGSGETAAEYAERLVEAGLGTVLTLPHGAFDTLASITRERLLEIEQAGDATIFWQTQPTGLLDVGGLPMALFDDRRTPDLQFDHIIYALGGGTPLDHLSKVAIEFTPDGEFPPSVYVLGDEDHDPEEARVAGFDYVSPGHAWHRIRDQHFPDLKVELDLDVRPTLVVKGVAERLREKHYNATITEFQRSHSDLWVIKVEPDGGTRDHDPGQYATLALGYWEPRLDGLDEHLEPGKEENLVRRSYSISHPMLDDDGNLIPATGEHIEFYIVLVRPEGMDKLPELTPRLALKKAGDRIFMGPKMAGRYTLKPVTNPEADIFFMSTGTGEAPHNYMLADLLARGHKGRIVAACCVRYNEDLGYLDTHRRLEELYPNYTYVPLTTREPETINNKVYIQDLIGSGLLEEKLGHELDPANSHFFLCGNPSMIGLAEWDGDQPTWPESLGVCEILYERGYTIDHRGVEGNVHFEEYW